MGGVPSRTRNRRDIDRSHSITRSKQVSPEEPGEESSITQFRLVQAKSFRESRTASAMGGDVIQEETKHQLEDEEPQQSKLSPQPEASTLENANSPSTDGQLVPDLKSGIPGEEKSNEGLEVEQKENSTEVESKESSSHEAGATSSTSSNENSKASLPSKKESIRSVDSFRSGRVDRSLSEHTLEKLIPLPSGGYWLQVSPEHVLQIGCPPETIKDSMTMGLEVPQYFIVYGELFSRAIGINTAELEFPAYFNFFIRRKRTVILTTANIEKRIRDVFQETLLGPEEHNISIEDDFAEGMSSDNYPHFKDEGEWLDPARKTFTVDTLLDFRLFEETDVGPDHPNYKELFVNLTDTIRVVYDRKNSCFLIQSSDYLDKPLKIPRGIISFDNKDELVGLGEGNNLSAKAMKTLPQFGITMLGTSHGFDPRGQTTGFVLWANKRGTMVDPPSNAMSCLAELGISSRVIDSIVLTHCHSDHDAGTFRKLLFDQHIKVYTTKTILDSFIRKYAAITGLGGDFLQNLFSCHYVKIGENLYLHGAKWRFRYSLHTIPCIGFTVSLGSKTITYSADTHTDPLLTEKMYNEGVVGKGRRDALLNFDWDSSLILHEAGVPPIHTPMQVLQNLPKDVKSRLYVVHVAKKDILPETGLKTLETGDSKHVDVPVSPVQRAIEILDLFSTMDIFREAFVSFQDALSIMYLVEYSCFSDGELICRKGDKGDRCYIILRGSARVAWEQNGVPCFKEYHIGDYFGETSLVTGEPRNADVKAVGNVEAVSITLDTFMSIIKGTNIQNELISLANTRRSQSWQLMEKNSVVSRFTSSSKTQLETIMQLRTFSEGEQVWQSGEQPDAIMCIRSGGFKVTLYPGLVKERIDGINEKLEEKANAARRSTLDTQKGDWDHSLGVTGKTPPSLTRSKYMRLVLAENKARELRDGMTTSAYKKELGVFTESAFLGDFDAVLCSEPVATDVVCTEEGSTALVIKREDWLRYCSKFPGSLLFFMGTQFVV